MSRSKFLCSFVPNDLVRDAWQLLADERIGSVTAAVLHVTTGNVVYRARL